MLTRACGSSSQHCAWLDLAARDKLGRRDFFAFAELRAQHFDTSALRGHLEALVRDFNHFADLALHGAESAHGVLARIKELYFPPLERGPCARRGVAAADRDVDEIDVVCPIDARLVPAAPALVSG